MIGKVRQYVQKTYFAENEEDIPITVQTYLDLRFPPVKLPDGSLSGSSLCVLTPFDQCIKLLAGNDPDISKFDEGMRVNIRDGYRFIYGNWTMRYMFGWDTDEEN